MNKHMKIVFTWDDGALEDLRLFELHRKYNIPGMFFVPTYNKEGRDVLTPDMIHRASSDLISFGGHTVTHSYLPTIAPEDIDRELKDNRDYLSDITGKTIEHFCLPGGKYDESLLKVCYKYFKTVRTADTMNFKHNGALCMPSFHFFPRGKKSLLVNALRHMNISDVLYVAFNLSKRYFDLLQKMIEKKENSDAVIVIWGHSWEIEELGLWEELESLMAFIAEKYHDACVPYEKIFE